MSKPNLFVSNPSLKTKLHEKGSLALSRSIRFLSVRVPVSLLSLVALMGFSGSFWFSNQANAQNAGTRPTQTTQRADVARVNLTLNSQPNESYDTLIRRAEAAARDVAGRSFSQNAAIRGVAVTILGQNAGSIAPLLSLQVNRQNWISQPDTQRWATYFKNAPTL
ncbi:hypothetical protein H6S82_19845, partial [Planktothrix sp. FACHB-1355]|nr:hypothetical protein [Planktothrix sp. FACHB-1355]